MIDKILNRIKTIYLELINSFLILIVGYTPIHHFRRFFYRLCGMKISKGSAVHMFASIYKASGISIGKDSIIGEWVVLDGRDKLTIGNNVNIATGVMIYNGEHDINDENFKPTFAPVVVEDYVFIGPRSIILPGVTIKKGAVVAAGAVVTKDVEEFTIVGGIPAREIGDRQIKNLNYTLGRAAWFR